MKRSVLILALSLWIWPAMAQLKGTYCRSVIFSSTCITFLNDTEFEYDLSDCTSHRAGKGTYKLDRKNLTLTFTEPKPPVQNGSVIISETESQSDSVRFTVQVNDKQYGASLPFGNPVLVGNDGKTIAWGTTNESGNCTFNALGSPDSAFLKINYMFYQECHVQVTLNKNYAVKIALTPNPAEWIEPRTVWTWKLRSISGKEFTLKGKPKTVYKKD